MPNSLHSFTKSALNKLGLGGLYQAVIVWSPDYGLDTKRVSHWLDDLRIPIGTKRRLSIGNNLNRRLVLTDLKETKGLGRVMIFLGHGLSDALLGSAQGDQSDLIVNDNPYSKIYDTEMIDQNPSVLFAFCCNAGGQLGRQFGSEDHQAFLGFTAEVFIPLLDHECRKTWRDIIRIVAEEIINRRNIVSEHEELLRTLYDRAIDYYLHGKGQNNENAYYYILQLNWQRENLCHYH